MEFEEKKGIESLNLSSKFTQDIKYSISDTLELDDIQSGNLFIDTKRLPTVGSLIKRGRLRYNLTQSALAELTGLTSTEISRLEADKTLKPSKEVLMAVSPYTGYSYTYLLLCAGYSGIYDKTLYYNKKGELIPYNKIVADVYSADAEFLELLSDINSLPLEDIQLLKTILVLFKNEYLEHNNNLIRQHISELITNIKDFLREQLYVIIKLLNLSY